MALPYNLWSVLGTGTGLGGGDANTTGQDLQSALGFAQKYDPNASIGWTPEGNQYVNFNNSLLPQNVLGGHGIENIARGVAGSGERLGNPNLVLDDPVYGRVTAPQNLREKGPSMVDILGPMLVGGSVMGFPLLAGALSGGVLGGTAGSLGFMGNAMTKAPGLLNNMFGGGQGGGLSPQMQMLMQLLAARQGGGG